MTNIPGLPTIPTDNLYKFMALAGIVMLIVAPIFYAKYYISHYNIELEAIESLKIYKPAELYFKNTKELTKEEKIFLDKIESKEKENKQIQKGYELYSRFSNVILLLSIIMAAVGLALSIVGFWLWYNRVQKPLDKILLNETKMVSKK